MMQGSRSCLQRGSEGGNLVVQRLRPEAYSESICVVSLNVRITAVGP